MSSPPAHSSACMTCLLLANAFSPVTSDDLIAKLNYSQALMEPPSTRPPGHCPSCPSAWHVLVYATGQCESTFGLTPHGPYHLGNVPSPREAILAERPLHLMHSHYPCCPPGAALRTERPFPESARTKDVPGSRSCNLRLCYVTEHAFCSAMPAPARARLRGHLLIRQFTHQTTFFEGSLIVGSSLQAS